MDFEFDGVAADPTDTDVHELMDAATPPGDANTDAEEFFLVGSDGAEFQGLSIYDVAVDADDNVTVTVALADNPTDVPETQLRRGYVIGNTAGADEATDGNVMAAEYEAHFGNTVDPDLVSVQRVNADTFRYEFDEAVSDDSLDETLFFVAENDETRYAADSVARSALAADEARVVIADFTGSSLAETGVDAPVIGFVGDSAVTATDSLASENAGGNRPDEEALSLPGPEDPTDVPAGVTALPDLLDVTRTQNSVTGKYSVAFTFDQDVTGVVSEADFDLYDGNGTRFNVTGVICDVPGSGVTCDETNTAGDTVTFSIDGGFANYSNEQIAAAVTAAVQDSATSPVTTVPTLTEDGFRVHIPDVGEVLTQRTRMFWER